MKEIVLTGDRPTGKLHLGHYVGTLEGRLVAQESGLYDEIYIMIADAQALTDNAESIEKVQQNVIEVAKDYLAVGLDPHKVHFFIQSQLPALAEMTTYFMNLVTVSRVERNPTVKAEIQQKHFEKSLPVGFQCYPIAQAADILAFNTTKVPAGEDQEPMLELTRDIVKKFNSLYAGELVEPTIVLPDKKESLRLPGLDGNGKMSKSLGNAIYLADDAETVRQKVFSAYTDPNHIRVEDPGDTTNNMVFAYLEVFATPADFADFLPEYTDIAALKAHYQRGGLGDMVTKRFLVQVLNRFLDPIREKRAYFDDHEAEVWAYLKEGTERARKVTDKTLHQVKKAMGIDYFGENS